MLDYTSHECPVCKERFKEDDDIVVCPECGTPYHRECYNSVGHCLYKEEHGNRESWYSRNNNTEENKTKVCPKCSQQNDENAFFCKKCGSSLLNENDQEKENEFFKGAVPFIIDPLGGMDPEEKFSDDVCAKDLAKYVKVNTPYYMSVFKNIKENNRARFNFSAFLFTGGWLLYRKHYKLGAIITTIMALLMVASSYIAFAYRTPILSDIIKAAGIDQSVAYFSPQQRDAVYNQLLILPMQKIIMIILPAIIDLVQGIIMLIIGFKGNKIYFKHCISRINKIKLIPFSEQEYNQKLDSDGGVDSPITMLLIFGYITIKFLPILIL